MLLKSFIDIICLLSLLTVISAAPVNSTALAAESDTVDPAPIYQNISARTNGMECWPNNGQNLPTYFDAATLFLTMKVSPQSYYMAPDSECKIERFGTAQTAMCYAGGQEFIPISKRAWADYLSQIITECFGENGAKGQMGMFRPDGAGVTVTLGHSWTDTVPQ